MLVKVFGSALSGINATTITVEVNVAQGIKFFLVGLPDNAVKESQQRIESALNHSGFRMPGKKIVVNMAPADIKKEGSAYDLPIAIGILAASGQIPESALKKYIIMGELSLGGGLLPVKGILPIAVQAKMESFEGIIIPRENVHEASIVDGLKVYGAESLREVADFLTTGEHLQPAEMQKIDSIQARTNNEDPDFSEVKGQENIKRAMEIAAAGGHNLILIGPPGAGKTMLARRFSGILPPLTLQEALETTKIHSVAGKIGKNARLLASRPFRSPHHTISD